MNSQKIKIIEDIRNDAFEYVTELCIQHNLQGTYMTFYGDHNNDDEIVEARASINGEVRMYTVNYACGDDDSEIIEYIRGHIFMSYEALYELIFECNMNIDKVKESVRFGIRHEIGHIIYDNNRFAGKTVDEWNDHCSNHFPTSEKPLRKNASLVSRLDNHLKFMNLPEESGANNAIGITRDEIIEDFYRTHG